MGAAGSLCAQPISPVLPHPEDQVAGRCQVTLTIEVFLDGGLQKLEWQIYTKKKSNPYENTPTTTSSSLNSSLTTGQVLGLGGTSAYGQDC